MGNSNPLVNTCAYRVSTKAEAKIKPNAETDRSVRTIAKANRIGLATPSGTLNTSAAIKRIAIMFVSPKRAFDTDLPAIICRRFDGVATISSSVPCHFSNSIAKPDEYSVLPHIPIIPPPKTAYNPNDPLASLKSVRAMNVKTKGAITFGMTH